MLTLRPGSGTRNSLLAALALLVLVATVDDHLSRTLPRGSERLSVMEIRTGGNTAGRGKVVIRRDFAQQVMELVADPSNPLWLSPQEIDFARGQLGVVHDMLAQALWSGCRLVEGLPEDRMDRMDDLLGDPLVVHTAMRAGPRWFMEELDRAYGPASGEVADASPPPGWDPETDDPQAWARWRSWIRRDSSFLEGSLLDFSPHATLIVLILDQKEHPERGAAARVQGAHARNFAASALEVDRQWNLFFSLLYQGGSGRSQVLPPVPTDMQAPGQSNDLPVQDLLRSLRENRAALGGR